MKLKDICTINSSTISRQTGNCKILYLDTSSITENTISNVQGINLFEAPSRAQRKVQDMTILYSLVRPNLKHYGILKNPPENLIVSTGFATIDVINKDIVDPLYLFYWLTQESLTNTLHSIAQNAVSAYPSLNPSDLGDLELNFPDILKQRKIGKFLDSINSKISLNRSINEELERMAKEVYDYWFVQFEFPMSVSGESDLPELSRTDDGNGQSHFPDEHGRPYKSSGGKMVYNPVLKREVPAGWEVKKVKNVVTHINTGLNPRDNFKLGGGDIKYITVKNLTLEGNIDFTSCDTIDEEALAKVHNRSNIQKGDVLFASISPLGRCFYIDQEPSGWDINESVFAIRPNADEISGKYLYLFLKSQEFVKKAEKSATGSIFLGIRMETLKGIDILLPANDVLKEFDKAMNNIIGKQHQIFDENEHLSNQRDELLPLLMNGQVEV